MHPYELSPAIVAPKPIPAPQPPGYFSQGHRRAAALRVRLPEHLERLLEPYGLASPSLPDRVILSSDAISPDTGIQVRNRRSPAPQNSSPASRRPSVSRASAALLKLQLVDGPTYNVQRLFSVQPVEEAPDTIWTPPAKEIKQRRTESLPPLRTESKSLSPSRKLSRQSIIGQLATKGKAVLDGYSELGEDGCRHLSAPSTRTPKTVRRGKSSPSLLCQPAKQDEGSSPSGSRKRIRINSIAETDGAALAGEQLDHDVDRHKPEASAGKERARTLWKRAIQLVIKDLKAKDSHKSSSSGPTSPSSLLEIAINRKKRRLEVFKRLQDDGEIHRDNLPEALVALGYRNPNPVWVEEALVGLSEFSTLDLQEFDAFLGNYEENWRNEGTEIFELVKDGAASGPPGKRSISCLPELLKAYDMNPLQHVLDQAVVAEGISEYLNAVNFMRISEGLQENECFTPAEAAEIKAAFRRFDFAQEGLLQDHSLASALRYLGRVSGKRAAATLASELFGEGPKTAHDFLAGLRRHQEQQDHRMRLMLVRRGRSFGYLPGGVHRLKHLLGELGYIADLNAIQDAADGSGNTGAVDEELDINKLWKFLMAYIANEGMSSTDVEKAKKSLEASKLRCNRLSAERIPRPGLLAASALRGMGYATSCDLGEKLAEEVGLRKSEELELKDFLKLVRMYRELLAESAKLVWQEGFDIGGTLIELVPEGSELLSAHTKALMGCPVISSICDALTKRLLTRQAEGKAVKWTHLAHAACSVREAMRVEMQAFYGFSPDKIRSLHEMFEEAMDGEREGTSGGSGRGVNQLLLQLFPDLATSKSGRPTFLWLLQEEKLELNKGISWQDFLKVARWCQELDELRQLNRQDAVVLKHDIAAEDVRELRDAFLGKKYDRTSMDLETFKDMVKKVIPLGHNNENKVTRLFKKTATRKEYGVAVDFPEFLVLVRSLKGVDDATESRPRADSDT